MAFDKLKFNTFHFKNNHWDLLKNETVALTCEYIALDPKTEKKEPIDIPGDFLSHFPKLKELDLSKVSERITSFNFLYNEKLPSLVIAKLKKDVNIEFNKIPELTELVLNDTLFFSKNRKAIIDNIKKSNSMKRLYINGWDMTIGFSDLMEINNINYDVFHIDLIELSCLNDKLVELLKIMNITSLNISYFSEFTNDLSSLLNLPLLNTIIVSKDDKLSASFIQDCKKLKIDIIKE